MPKSQKTLNKQCKSASQSSFISLLARLAKNAKIKRGRLLMDRIYCHLFKFWDLRVQWDSQNVSCKVSGSVRANGETVGVEEKEEESEEDEEDDRS